ncbi:hypothetical protein [Nocardioides montaniterrae]
MRRIALILAALMLAFTVTACGKEAAPTNTAAGFSCPSDNTKAFATTRFVADMGLAAGTFHHWIYNPYKAGQLSSDAKGHTLKRIKAGAAAALTYHLLGNAVDNVKASSKLCPLIGSKLAALSDSLSNLKSKILHGDLGSITGIFGSLGGLTSLLKSNGTNITEKFNG